MEQEDLELLLAEYEDDTLRIKFKGDMDTFEEILNYHISTTAFNQLFAESSDRIDKMFESKLNQICILLSIPIDAILFPYRLFVPGNFQDKVKSWIYGSPEKLEEERQKEKDAEGEERCYRLQERLYQDMKVEDYYDTFVVTFKNGKEHLVLIQNLLDKATYNLAVYEDCIALLEQHEMMLFQQGTTLRTDDRMYRAYKEDLKTASPEEAMKLWEELNQHINENKRII